MNITLNDFEVSNEVIRVDIEEVEHLLEFPVSEFDKWLELNGYLQGDCDQVIGWDHKDGQPVTRLKTWSFDVSEILNRQTDYDLEQLIQLFVLDRSKVIVNN